MDKNFTSQYIVENADAEKMAANTLQKIKELSTDLKIQPNPIHFSLIYELLLNEDKEFVKEIQTLIDTASYNHETAQIMFTNLWAKNIQRIAPCENFSHLVDNLLLGINTWVTGSKSRYTEINHQINIAEKHTAQNALEHIQKTILPQLKASQEDVLELQNNVEEVVSEVNTLRRELNKAAILARTDDLTGLPNKRGLNEFLKEALSKAENEQTNLSLVAFDIDFFKAINDEFGHLVGDSVLKYLAKIFRNETKDSDLIARTGGEEFLLVLQDTSINHAEEFANKIRRRIDKSKLHIKKTNQTIKLTISAGVSCYRSGESADDFIDRADKALYSSKNTGRNKVTLETNRNSY